MAEDRGLAAPTERNHRCERSERWELFDARGISCGWVCAKCEAAKRAKYRTDIFSNSTYDADEPIDGDE